MKKIISIAHQKGGVGKSTLAFNMASLFKDDLRVVLVDVDVQGSNAALRDNVVGFDIIVESDVNKIQELPYDLIIIDTPPYLTNNLLDIFYISTFILVPTKAGIYDILAIRSTVEFIKLAQRNNPNLKSAVVLNMIKHRTGLTDDIREQLNNLDIHILNSQVYDRVSFTRSPLTGGVGNTDDIKAQEDLVSLTSEILNYLNS